MPEKQMPRSLESTMHAWWGFHYAVIMAVLRREF
jgi:hypothetical protein